MNLPIVRTALVFVVLIDALYLGRFSVEFNGTGLGWASLILGMVVLAGALFALMTDFWRAHA
jgi:hypothetical protein